MIYDAFVYYSHELISLGSSIVEVMEKEGLICWDSKRDSMGFSDIADALSSSKAYVLIGPDPYESTYRYTLLREMQKYRTTQSFFVINDANTVNLIKGSCNDVYEFNVTGSSESIYRNCELKKFLFILKNTVENVIIKEPMKVFISHSHKDKEQAEELWKELTAYGIKCWIDTRDIPPGHSYPDAIVKGLEWCNCLVLIYSKNVLDSVDIPNELEVVHADRKKIIPFLIDDSKIEGGYRYYLPRQQWVNAYGCEFTKAIERLVVELHNDKIDNTDLQSINVTLSRNEEQSGLDFSRSEVETTDDIFIEHNADKHNRHYSVAKVSFFPRIKNKYVSGNYDGQSVWGMIGGVVGQLLIGRIYGAIGGVVNASMSSPNWRNAKVSDAKVYTSVFAPAEIAPKQHLIIQVYLHLPEETEKVKSLASEADKNAERRGYEPLEVPLKKGDNVEIELNVNGDSLLYNCRKSVIWQGSFVKRAFDFVVPADIDVYELSSSVNIYVNGAIAGELIFLTAIVDSPRRLNTNVYARPTKKLFISYSHKDVASAERIAKIHEALGIDVFFDKHRLKAGYIYSEEISKFIKTADTFVLCWSENAAKSDYVEKERQEALALAYPQSKPREQARLRIHPYNIEPHAVPPADMIEQYHFEDL